MPRKLYLLIATLAVPSTLAASETPLPGASTKAPHHHSSRTREEVVAHTKDMFARLDVNHVGYITLDTIKAAHAQKVLTARKHRFDMLDTNHDGMISRDEFVAAGTQPESHSRPGDNHPEPRFAMQHRHHDLTKMFAKADADHDGKLTLAELTTFRLARFDKMDANHDGIVSPEEARMFHQAQRADWHAREPKPM